MVAWTYVIRQIEDSDRVDHERQIKSAEARGDYAEAQIIPETFARWEREQGQQK